jgi:thiosulfate dehydrogenase [quinone] large subunit
MTQSTTDRSFILVFRLLMAWTFLYAASHQVFNPKFSAAAFLSHTKTFHDVYAVLASPTADPALTFLVSYGHLLIGLSLLVGLMVRVSAAFGVALLVMYWTAHMDWPFIENANNFIPHRLCDAVRLSDRLPCRTRVGSRRLGREAFIRRAASVAAVLGRLISNVRVRGSRVPPQQGDERPLCGFRFRRFEGGARCTSIS